MQRAEHRLAARAVDPLADAVERRQRAADALHLPLAVELVHRSSLADVPGPNVPFPPMEAELVRELPAGEGWQYEPKWDGFRGVLENDGGELALWSRNERPLLRYFPELAQLGELLPPHSALDGEIVIARDGVLEFDSMQMRLHPAESRVRKLVGRDPGDLHRLRPAALGRRARPQARRSRSGAPSCSGAATASGSHPRRRRSTPRPRGSTASRRPGSTA